MATRLQITLSGEERSALITLSQKELREPAAQVRFMLRRELIRKGHLTSAEKEIVEKTAR